MFGQIDVKVRPLRLAYLVDPHDSTQVRQAIQLSSTLWGGSTFPILPVHKRMPATWKEKPFKAPQASQVMLGSIEAFDPDILVQLGADVPAYVSGLGITIINGDAVWEQLDKDHSPKFGLGIFELLKDIFAVYFKYKAKYPVRVVLPVIPAQLSLFWTSLFDSGKPSRRTPEPELEVVQAIAEHFMKVAETQPQHGEHRGR
jgi:hypothetical protein